MESETNEIRNHVQAIRQLTAGANLDFDLSERLVEDKGPSGLCTELWVTGTVAGIADFGSSLIEAATSIDHGEPIRLDGLNEQLVGSGVAAVVVSRDDTHQAEVPAVERTSNLGFWLVAGIIAVVVGLAIIGAFTVIQWII